MVTIWHCPAQFNSTRSGNGEGSGTLEGKMWLLNCWETAWGEKGAEHREDQKAAATKEAYPLLQEQLWGKLPTPVYS